MFLKKFFDKSFKHYKEKGDKYLNEGRFADARHAYGEALEKLKDCEAPTDDASQIRQRWAEAGNQLALINIEEADHAARGGDTTKAGDHLRLACELAEDPAIRERAERLQRELPKGTDPPPHKQHANHSCSGCGTSGHGTEELDGNDDQLMAEDRFSFLLHTLPERLAQRYATMGEEFAGAYLAAHEGDERQGLAVLQNLLGQGENDILLYEIALIHFKSGRFAQCEQMLRRAIHLNPENELCYLGLVQLLTESGRARESIGLLEQMVSAGMMGGQAVIILADVHLQLGDEGKAMDLLSTALSSPITAKVAAERLIPILEGQNRREEAAYLFKTHMKGCC